MISKMLDSLAHFYGCLDYVDNNGHYQIYLPLHKQLELKKHVDKFLAFYSYLTSEAHNNSRKHWHKVSKFNTLWHIADECDRTSPRWVWCYSNEDNVGRLSRIGYSTHFGNPPAKRRHAILTKYIWGLLVRMKNLES